MADTQDSRPSVDGNPPTDLPPSQSPPVEDNGAEKPSHPVDEEGSESPRASKKRRTESGTDEAQAPSQQDAAADQIPGNQIEKELASALGSGFAENAERDSDGNIKVEGTIEKTPEQETTEGTSTIDPDMATVISNIMNHAERVEDELGRQQRGDNNDQSAPKGLAFVKANSHLKTQSLPILDNLSTQILSMLAKSSYQDITAFVSEPDSESGQAYATMRSLFDHTKKVYSTKTSFLSASELGLTEPHQIDVIRKANVASFVSSIFGTQEIGFAELNDNFLEVFVPEGARLLKVQGALYLELKTQAFIQGMNNTDRSRTQILFDLFPDTLEQEVLSRRPGSKQLAPSELDFLSRARSRREIILGDINNEAAMMSLPEKYQWEDFLRDLSSYVTKNFEAISQPQVKKAVKGRRSSSSNGDTQEAAGAAHQSQFSVAQPAPEVPVDKNMHGDLVARAARAAQIALQGHGLRRSQNQAQQQPSQEQQQPQGQQTLQPQPQTQAQPQPQPIQPQQPQQHPAPQNATHGYAAAPQTIQQHQQHQQHYQQSPPPQGYQQQPGQFSFQQSPFQGSFHQYSPAPPSSASQREPLATNHGYMPGIPHYSQSQPTQVLYERARMAASVKASPSSRKTGLPSQRRPWTTEEENALMAGLDRVKGPHWSQILAMFGPGGTISEALKDRNQVQLKDKARNLKLFFLKSGIEVPYYLKFVTGELKTRAPAQAAKREARERQKKQGEEDKAHVEGIKGMMALAGAHSQPGTMTPGTEGMSQSPIPHDTGNQAAYDQTEEHNLMQTLGQEVHGEQFGQTQHHDVHHSLPTVQ
ncbi:MYB DNA binding protein [Aspergillus sclerotialis]|uniref:MYB DNA binding protein n=1 Tax=Aspergillus sclerotialis TaxID=2070753 RepID=A0A3A2Z6C7_9EURO|nr:MYB DNA binding protein [Aspergillus sclerotialis]